MLQRAFGILAVEIVAVTGGLHHERNDAFIAPLRMSQDAVEADTQLGLPAQPLSRMLLLVDAIAFDGIEHLGELLIKRRGASGLAGSVRDTFAGLGKGGAGSRKLEAIGGSAGVTHLDRTGRPRRIGEQQSP